MGDKTRRFSEIDCEDIQRTLREDGKWRDLALFVFGHRTGYRISESLSLDVEDVWDGEEIHDVVTVPADAMKNDKSRTVPLHDHAKRVLREYLEHRGWPAGDEPLFRSGRGGRLTRKGAWSAIKRICDRAGVNKKNRATHSLRKTFGWRIYQEYDIRTAQVALGHSKVTTTQDYLGVDKEKAGEAILGVD